MKFTQHPNEEVDEACFGKLSHNLIGILGLKYTTNRIQHLKSL